MELKDEIRTTIFFQMTLNNVWNLKPVRVKGFASFGHPFQVQLTHGSTNLPLQIISAFLWIQQKMYQFDQPFFNRLEKLDLFA